MAVARVGWMRRSVVAPGTLFGVVLSMLEYMRSEQHARYVSQSTVTAVIERVRWAQSNGVDSVAFLTFWWLYDTWNDFALCVHDQEREVEPLAWTETELARVRRFANKLLDELRCMPYQPCNVRAIIEFAQNAFTLAVSCRVAAVLDYEQIEPVAVHGLKRAPVSSLLRTEEQREAFQHYRKRTAEVCTEIDWQEYAEWQEREEEQQQQKRRREASSNNNKK